MVSVNAIQGTLIADNAITAVHIASNAVASIQIAENNVTARELAANTITVAQLADDCVEADKIADGVITTNHLNKAMISSQTEVAVATGDFILLGDTSDSNNLKKAPISSILAGTLTTAAQTNITSLGTLTALTVAGDISLSANIIHTGDTDTIIGLDTNTIDFTTGNQAGMSMVNGVNFMKSATPTDPSGSAEQSYIYHDNASNTSLHIGNQYGSDSAAIHLETRNNKRVTILGDGKVGIGTTSPAETLHVKRADGTALIVESSNDQNNTGDRINIEFRTDAAQGIAKIIGGKEGNYQSAGARSGYLAFQTINANSYAERMRINSSGNVGIGNTAPSAHHPDFRSIQLGAGGSGISGGATGNRNINLSNNAYLASGGSWKYVAADHAANIEMYDGTMHFKVAPSGSANATVSWNEAMTIPNSGNVGIGTSSPNANLEVFDASGGAGTGVRINCNNGGSDVWDLYSTTAGRLYVKNPNYSGGVYLQHTHTAWTGNSDENLKENITSLGTVGDKLKNYRTSYFNWKSDTSETPRKQIGFIAQDWEDDFPEVVNRVEGEPLGMQYTETIPILLKYIQELEARIETLEG